MSYQSFLERKHRVAAQSGFEPVGLSDFLYPFQRELVTRAVRAGKYALFTECGTGKTAMQLEWGRQVCDYTGGRVLVLAPLAVTAQTAAEGERLGIPVTMARSSSDIAPGINVTNYDKLKHFDPADFVGVVLDESSILKNFTGATKRAIFEAFAATRYKLCATATPAPNDHMELGNHAEFLDVMRSSEILSRWFINDTMRAGGYRLKGHAERDFWRFVASWSASVEKPSDIGFSDDGWSLPSLSMHEHVVSVDHSVATDGMLFRVPDLSATGLHRELRLTAGDRAAAVADIVNHSDEAWIVWCHADYEADELTARIPDAIEVRGSDKESVKESRLIDFSLGRFRVIVTKPSIAGFGLNWQHCHNMAFVGLSYSYESLYQAVRRSLRYGQTKTVHAHLFRADTEGALLQTLDRKRIQHESMKAHMVAAMRDFQCAKPMSNNRVGSLHLPEWITDATTIRQ